MPPDPRLASELLAESSWLHRLALRLVSEPERAADAAQDVLARALERPPAAATPLRAWLATVLRNVLRQEHRGGARRAAREQAHAGSRPIQLDGEPADDLAARLELFAQLATAVRTLDEPYRTTVALRYLEDLPVRSVAGRMGVPEKTVYTRLERALVLLRERLDRAHGSRSAWAQLFLPFLTAPPAPAGAAPASASIPATLAPAIAMTTLWKWTGACAALATVGYLAVRTIAPVERRPASPTAAADAAGPAELVPSAPPPLRATPAQEPEREAVAPRPGAPAAPAPAVAPVETPAALLVGFVRDLERRPVAGIDVAYDGIAPTPSQPVARAPLAGATSADDGRFELPLPEGPARLVARGRGYATVLAPSLTGAAAPPEPPVVWVAAERDFAGLVVDPDGLPVADAEIEIQLAAPLARELAPGAFASVLPQARTSADGFGRFAFPTIGAAPGSTLVARATGFETATMALPEASSADLVVTLVRAVPVARELSGRVEHADGRPAAGAHVSTGGEAVKVGEDGAFALDVQDGATTVRAVLAGHLPAELALDAIPAGRRQDVVLVLGGEPLAIRGRVVDHAGEPVPGARVWTYDGTRFGNVVTELGQLSFALTQEVEDMVAGGEPGSFDGRRVRADADGRFEIRGLLERRYALYALDPRTHELAGPFDVRAGDDSMDLVLPGEPTSRVAGRVTTLSGAPVAGASVGVARVRRDPDGRERTHRAGPDMRVETDAEGRFVFPALCTEGTRLVVSSSDAPREASYDLAAQADPEDVVLQLAATCHLRVRLSDPERADSLSLRDARDELLDISFQLGGIVCVAGSVTLRGGVSDLITTDESATTLVLSKGPTETERIPLRLVPGEVNEIEL